ncbi:rhomboid family protein [Genlisea aurea]|uniref:Rhomboid family protein n=1 Tax=Genlisea aurea TaxID=192259 RepID=S8C873_9LAMI|nr:rhomboid family protein [Genlisea aurea]
MNRHRAYTADAETGEEAETVATAVAVTVGRQLLANLISKTSRSFSGSNQWWSAIAEPSIRNHRLFLNPSLLLAKQRFSSQISAAVLRFQPRRNLYSLDSVNRGGSSVSRKFTVEGVVIGLISANAAVFLLWRVFSPHFMVSNFTVSVENFTSGRVHTLLTSAFSHRDAGHVISNMVGLYFFGMSIGRSFGPEYLLKLYVGGALVGSLFFLIHHAFIAPSLQRNQTFGLDHSRVPGLGASGAVNAIMLLDIFLFPTKTLYFDFIIPVPAILLGVFLIGKDILRIVEGDPAISGAAHLGGATVAALAWALSRKGRFRRF